MNEIVEGYMRPCDVCGGSGDVEDGDYYKYCEACDGTGIYKTPAAPEQGAADVVQRHEFKFGNTNVIGDAVEINGRWFVEQEWLEGFVEMHSERSQQLEAKEAENQALRELCHRAAMLIASEGNRYIGLIADLKSAAKGEALGKGG